MIGRRVKVLHLMLAENVVKPTIRGWTVYKMRVWRFFWMIMSCTESMVAFNNVVSVALV